MPHTQYFLINKTLLEPYTPQGTLSYIPVIPGDTSPDGDLIVAYLGDLDPTQDPNADTLPDALRQKVITLSQAEKLAQHGVVLTDTTFDVVDKLVTYSRDMRFQTV